MTGNDDGRASLSSQTVVPDKIFTPVLNRMQETFKKEKKHYFVRFHPSTKFFSGQHGGLFFFFFKAAKVCL